MSLRWSSYVAPKPPAQKRKTRFSCRIALCSKKKLCYEVTLCENCQRQSFKAFIGLSIRAKMIGVARPVKSKFCIKWTFAWRGSRADRRFLEIRRILHWNMKLLTMFINWTNSVTCLDTLCYLYLNIGDNWRARLNGSAFRNVFCAVERC